MEQVNSITSNEQKHSFFSFCSFICLSYNKKLNFANIFILLLKDDSIRSLYKKICDYETDYEAIKSFLDHEPLLYRSKYIKKFLTTHSINLKP